MQRIARKTLLSKRKVTVTDRMKSNSSNAVSTFYQKLQLMNGIGRVCIARKLGGIGDVLMTMPAVRQIKQDFPMCDLTYACDMQSTQNNIYYELIKNLSFIDHIIDGGSVNANDYDLYIDISAVCLRYEKEGLPSINRIDLFAKAIGIKRLKNHLPPYKIEQSEFNWAQEQYARYPDKRIVVLHTASNEDKRCWPIDKYIELIEKCKNLPIQFIILDYNNKKANWNYKNCSNYSDVDLRKMAALISKAELFVGPDSGPMHLAGALKIKSIVLFGSVPPQARINYYSTHQAITADVNCLGCWYKQCPYNVRCMSKITSDMVYEKIVEKLKL